MDKPQRKNGNKRPYDRPYDKKGGGAHAARARMDERAADDNLIEGKNAVWEAVKNGRPIDKILFASGSVSTVGHIIAAARQNGIPAQECDRRKLDQMSITGAHQGIVALCAAVEYKSIDDMLALAESRGEKPIIVLCDGITDPHNLGAIIRSAEIAGAHGVVIPRRRSAGLNAACAKAAAGALEHLPVAKCANIQSALEDLKRRNLFVFAADMDGQCMYDADFDLPCALVIGSEGAGISQAVKKQCDFVVSIPQKGVIPSLNASNAAAVLLFEIYRQRR